MITYSEVDIFVDASGDIAVAANGDLQMAVPSGVLLQDVAFRLRTDQGDFRPHPDLGANLDTLIGEPNTKTTSGTGEQFIINSLTSDNRVAPGDLMVKGVPISLSSIMYYVFIRDGMTTFNVTPNVLVDLNTGLTSF